MTEKQKKRNPNLAPCWVKGQSGNPHNKNRPKGETHHTSLTAAYRARIEESNLASELVEIAIEAAKEKDYRFLKELWDRLDGAVTQEVRVIAELETRIGTYLEAAAGILSRADYKKLVNAWADIDDVEKVKRLPHAGRRPAKH